MNSLFEAVELAPRDPIFGLNAQFNADTRADKVNLCVGVYSDDNGQIPLLRCVHKAELARADAALARGYLPMDGLAAYDKGAQTLLLGHDSPVIADQRAVTIQALGGTGALKVGADFLKRLLPESEVFVSDPTWANHRGIFEGAGFKVGTYAYYDAATHGLDFNAMLAALQAMPARSIVVLHACCHNPTGVDASPEQWKQIAQVVQDRQLVPFLDIAYQGFGDGVEEDAFAVRLFASLGITMFVSSSFSKSFSLYGERIGALTIVAATQDEGARVLSQVKRVIRANYSNPPTHGGALVSDVLNSAELRSLWESELAAMRERIRAMRDQLVEKLKGNGVSQNFDFVRAQRGMFSYSGLDADLVERLRTNHGIYAVNSGRICVASLNTGNIDHVAKAIAQELAAA
jgi:aromatic-amino-acid transaminase